MATISLPGVGDQDLGRGYDSVLAALVGSPFDSDTVPDPGIAPKELGADVSLTARIVESSDDLTTTLNISAQAEFGFGAFGGSVSTSYANSIQTNSYDLFIVGSCDVALSTIGYSTKEIGKLRLSKDVLNGLQEFPHEERLSAFRQGYGDYFITGLKTGGTLFFVVRISANSRQDRTNLEVTLGGKGTSWSASSDFKTSIDKVHRDRSVSVTILQSGGAWNFASDLDAGSLYKTLIDFPNYVHGGNSIVKAIEVAPYTSVQNWPAASMPKPTPILTLGKLMEKFRRWHDGYRALLGDIDFIMDNMIAFNDPNEADLTALKNKVERNDQKLIDALTELVEDPLSHLDTTPEQVCPNADPKQLTEDLPEWRKDLPTCAADIVKVSPNAPSGEYDIWLNGDHDQRVKLHCRMPSDGNVTEPAEYVTLINPNVSEVAAGGHWGGTTVRTTWEKVRIHPEKNGQVDLDDFTYATSVGAVIATEGERKGEILYTRAPYGSTANCDENGNDAHAVVDLTGTSFSIVGDIQWNAPGQSYLPTFKLDKATDKVWSWWMRGGCGSSYPAVNGTRGIQLAYSQRTTSETAQGGG